VSAVGFSTTANEEVNKVTSYILSFPETIKTLTEASAGYEIFLGLDYRPDYSDIKCQQKEFSVPLVN
jgi:hypothetical protein